MSKMDTDDTMSDFGTFKRPKFIIQGKEVFGMLSVNGFWMCVVGNTTVISLDGGNTWIDPEYREFDSESEDGDEDDNPPDWDDHPPGWVNPLDTRKEIVRGEERIITFCPDKFYWTCIIDGITVISDDGRETWKNL